MKKNALIYRLSLCLIVLFSILQSTAQYTITGTTCVVPNFNYYGYTISGGPAGYNDKWCVTGGTITGTSNSCLVNSGNGPTQIYVTWNSGIINGTISYYANSSNSSPSATFTVSNTNNIINSQMGPYLYVSINKPTVLKLTGSDAGMCTNNYFYYWQRSIDNINFSNIDNANSRDYLNTETFAQTVYFRRMIIVNNAPGYSASIPVMPNTALNAGSIAPLISTVKAGTSGPTFSATSTSGGSMCGPGAYTYQWETSTDNLNWVLQSGVATNFSPGIITQKTYVRLRVNCGPLPDISNVAVINLYKPLEAGTIGPNNKVISLNTDPGIFSGNPARYGNPGTYTYQWQKSSTSDFSSGVTDISNTNSLNYNPGSFVSTGVTYFRRKVTCDGVTAYSNILSIVAGTPSTDQNYVRTRTIIKPSVTTKLIADALTSTQDVIQTTQYFDGLGKPSQTVVKQGSLNSAAGHTTAYDFVKPSDYDYRGREATQYLPYASPTATNGLFKTNVFGEQYAFNNALFSGENYYHSIVNFQPTPDSRISGQMPQGLDWAGSNVGVESIYSGNLLADNVRVWDVSNIVGNFGSYSTTSVYADGQLYKSITVDEQGKQLIEFKNKDGLVILKKVQLTGNADDGAGTSYAGWLSTYYIYDNFNNLRAVIQPEGVKYLSQNNWNLGGTEGANVLEGQFFRYEYDQRNRMTMKKIPAAGAVYMVYDNRDRLVMTQDANMRVNQQWLVNIYDIELNRPVTTGIVSNSAISNPARTFSQHMTAAGSSVTYPFVTPPGSGWQLLTESHYDDYNGVLSSLPGSFDNTWAAYFTTNQPYAQPQVANTALKGKLTYTKTIASGTSLYAVNIYDHYGRLIQMKSNNLISGTDIITTQYNFAGQPLTNVVKHGTGIQTAVTISNMFYDILGRIIKIEKRASISSIPSPGNAMSAPKIISETKYDALGQVQNKTLGRKRNPDGSISTTDPLAKLDYEYNIRGWLLSINKNYILQGTNDDRYFALNLAYNKLVQAPANAPVYPNATYKNGNIQGMIWRSAGDNINRRYNFFYDNANRLLSASFAQQDGTTWNTNAGIDFSMQMGYGMGGPPGVDNGYDANGNILEMKQWGAKIGGSQLIDNLQYTYLPKSNKLQNVRDASNDVNSKLGDFKTLASHPQSAQKSTATDLTTITDYDYDVNGNITKDNNKGIGTIIYNHLNLPVYISVSGKGQITYMYNANGNKLQKTVLEFVGPNNITTTTKYVSGFVYESKNFSDPNLAASNYTDKLQFIAHEEGRIRAQYNNSSSPQTITGISYDYLLKDHLGNVRMVLTEEQQQDQYPAATMEGTYSTTAPESTSMINHEKKFYTVNNTYVENSTSMPGWSSGKDYQNNNGNPPYNVNYPSGTTPASTSMSGKVYRLNAASPSKTGLGIVLKVMAGDKIDIHGKSYYQSTTTYDNSNSTVLALADIIGAFIGSPDKAGFGLKGITAGTMETINTGLIPSTFIRGLDNTSSLVPKAYINFIFFDEQFKYVGGNFSRVGSSGIVKSHWFTDLQLQNIAVPKNGYIYVYVSNESNANVYFDNLQVFHTRGPILEETHYYPFGLPMEGISTKALAFGNPENKNKYNGKEEQRKEFSDGSGLELLDYGARMYDNQIGRFMSVDPMSDFFDNETPYGYVGGNPISYIDFEGRFKIRIEAGANLSLSQISRFDNILRNLEGYLLENPNIVTRISGVTGLAADKILEYAKYGSGPTIVIGRGETEVTKTDFLNQEISFESAIATTLQGIGGDSKSLSTYSWAALMLVLHELGHYGDRESNNGDITGQPNAAKDSKGNLMLGKQIDRESLYDHRGTDIEEFIMYGGVRSPRTPYLGITYNNDGTLDHTSIFTIQKSPNFNLKYINLIERPKPKPNNEPTPPKPPPPKPPKAF